jgi:YHS domain-containing protein
MPRDPVCGMEVDEKDAAAVSQQDGRTYYFCSAACKSEFERQQDERGAQFEKAVSHPASAESDIVRSGGVAQADAEIEDITRDTYGFVTPPSTSPSRDDRIREADRAAEEAGMPGVRLPESGPEMEQAPWPEAPKRTGG